MAYELRELSGSLFKNDKKETEKHPNMTGSALIGGVDYWVAAWTKEGKKGKFISLSFTPKEDKPASRPTKPSRSNDDDIPF